VLFQRAPALPEARPITRPLFVRLDETQLADDGGEASIDSPADDELWRRAGEQAEFLERVGQFFADEGVAAVIVPSEGNESGGATGGTVYADQNYTFGWRSHQPAHAMRVPLVIVALEAYGRLVRLARRTPVRMEVNVDVEWTGDAVEAFNVFAEIQGTDTGVRGEEVFVSAHLDSWAAGTGATDNGAGVLVAMEVMRILNTLHLAPRRTVRIALWTGEEQGMLGSREYVKRHVARVPLADTREDARLPERMRRVVGPIAAKSDHARISAVYTVDGGSGRIRGVGLSGNAALAPIFRAWLAPLRDLGVAAVSLHRGCSGDAFTFHQVGIPAPSFIHDPLEYETRTRHTNHDTYERLLPEDLQQAAAVVATLVYNTARRPALLPRLSAAG
jgi:acetylornithine deacetylase/succinyl-diaminopimelate desuccinylase-like protein